jgi:epsilon-lactone hydrolase
MSIRMSVMQRGAVFFAQRAATRDLDLAKARQTTLAMERRFRLARGVTTSKDTIAGVPVRRYSSGGGTPGVVLHLHGGAYFCGSSNMARRYTAIVADGGPDLVSADYRLAPEHPYPAALDDAHAVYCALSDEPIVVVGDSAGGGLALALVQRVRDEGRPVPVGLAAIFPWADLTQSGLSWSVNAGRDLLTKGGLDQAAAMYAAGIDLRTPGVSPLFGAFTGFPPTQITVGTRDSLLDDARSVTAALHAAGAEVSLHEVTGAIHGFATLPTPEARAAIHALAEFARVCLARA